MSASTYRRVGMSVWAHHRHPERSEGPVHPEFELGRARSLAALGMTRVGELGMTSMGLASR
jgi:hypothetical protein